MTVFGKILIEKINTTNLDSTLHMDTKIQKT